MLGMLPEALQQGTVLVHPDSLNMFWMAHRAPALDAARLWVPGAQSSCVCGTYRRQLQAAPSNPSTALSTYWSSCAGSPMLTEEHELCRSTSLLACVGLRPRL